MSELSTNMVLFKSNYDDTSLADTYWVTKQHTLVTLDGQGNVTQRKWWIVTINMLNALVN